MLVINKLIFFLYIAILTTFALIPSNQSISMFPHFDKFIHFLLFLLLFFFYDRSSNTSVTFINLLFFFCYGLLLEILQGFTMTRSAEMLDTLANGLGLLVYFLFAPKLEKSINKK